MENKIYLNNIRITNAVDDDGVGRIEGFAAHWYKPNFNDERVNASSFDTFFQLMGEGKIEPTLNFNHNPERIIGKIDKLEAKDEGLWMQAHVNKNVAFVKETVWPLIEAGDLTGLSTEGYIRSSDDVEWLKDDTYFVRSFILTAVAVCPTPADGYARFSVANVVNNMRPTEEEVKEEIKKTKWYIMF